MEEDPRLAVLGYAVRLDEALEGHLSRGERRYAVKEVRGVVEGLSFRAALLDDRLVPGDRDLERALACLKAPEAVAAVLARRRPVYRRRRAVAAIRGWSILAFVLLAAWGLASLATGETSEPLASVVHANATAETATVAFQPIAVPEGLDRVDVTVHATNLDRDGAIVVKVVRDQGDVLYQRDFTREGRLYDHQNLPAAPGTWYVVVDYVQTKGAIRVDVVGVRSA